MVLPDIEREKFRTLPDRLQARIIGQDAAVARVAERLQHGELGLTTPGRPKASFLFLGPTGVGKTELTQQFTAELCGAGNLVRLDMSEYQTRESLALLLGTSHNEPGRVAEGFDACGGAGTLLLDEIEKAHARVLDVLLQLLDAARLTTGTNRVLDFSSWYCVLTSNIGAPRIMAMRKSKFETMERLVRQDAQRELRPEIFARVSAVVVFDKLDYGTQCKIAAALVDRELAALRGRGFALSADRSVVDAVIKRGYDDRLGARPMRDATELLVRNALVEDLLHGGSGDGCLRAHPSGTKLHMCRAGLRRRVNAVMETNSNNRSLRVVILKEDRLCADTIRRHILDIWPKAHIEVFQRGFDALSAIQNAVPDLFVTGVKIEDMDGLEHLEPFIETNLRVLIVAARADMRTFRMLEGLRYDGIYDAVCDEAENLAVALRRVAEGQSYISVTLLPHLTRQRSVTLEALTEMEQFVLSVIGDGCDNKTAAARLDLTVRTVASHRRSIMRKLKAHGVRERGMLVVFALRHGYLWVTPEGVFRPGFDRRLSTRSSEKTAAGVGRNSNVRNRRSVPVGAPPA